jgi:hypothetical protein
VIPRELAEYAESPAVDGRAVATGLPGYCNRGGFLFGGSTLREARGRGAYRVLVRARWDEAVSRGGARARHAGGTHLGADPAPARLRGGL